MPILDVFLKVGCGQRDGAALVRISSSLHKEKEKGEEEEERGLVEEEDGAPHG